MGKNWQVWGRTCVPLAFAVPLFVATPVASAVREAVPIETVQKTDSKDLVVDQTAADTDTVESIVALKGPDDQMSILENVRFVVRSSEMASVGSQLNAQISYLPKREGDRFNKDDVLVRFNCRQLDADREAALAGYKSYLATYKSQKQLLAYKAVGSLSVEQAYYQLEKAKADLHSLDVRRETCVVRAPFDGRVVQKVAQVSEIAQPNQVLLKIANDSKPELVLMVPSKWLPQLKEDETLRAKFDEIGEAHDAVIVQSTGLIDPVSQSARVIAELVDVAPNVKPGMSGTLSIVRQESTQ